MTNEELGITEFQRENLEKLAAYLETNPQERGFNMIDFFYYPYGGHMYPYHAIKIPKCETAACAVGHGPDAGIEPLESERWVDYSDRCFISKGDAWAWCFVSHWVEVDNTPIGAAKRIRWFLENGVPEDWKDQSYGKKPLCYGTSHLR